MKDNISREKVEKYFGLTKEALAVALKAPVNDKKSFDEIISMVKNYVSDAEHFFDNGDLVNAFSCIVYAHGWLDCGARLKIFKVSDNRLFVVDGE